MVDSIRVLVVDDEPEICTLLDMVLSEMAGWTVDTVPTAEIACDHLKEHQYDLLVCDRHLPGMSGLDLFRWVRQELPPLACVLITGHGSLPGEMDPAELGIDAFIEKPFIELEAFVEQLRGIVEGYRRR